MRLSESRTPCNSSYTPSPETPAQAGEDIPPRTAREKGYAMAEEKTPESDMARKMTAAERASQAAQLRAMRLSYTAIAKRLGYANASGAQKAAQRALKATLREGGDELRKSELESLDIAEAAIAKQILAGNLRAIDKLIKIKDHRAKLTGLYAPPKDSTADDMRDALKSFHKGLDAMFEDDNYGRPDDDDGDQAGARVPGA